MRAGFFLTDERTDRQTDGTKLIVPFSSVPIKVDPKELRYENVDWLYISAQWLVLVTAVTKLSIPERSKCFVHIEKCFVLKMEIEDFNYMARNFAYVWKIQRRKENVKIILRRS